MSDVAGIILAAGESQRMGRPKQLLPYGASTVLNATIAAFEASTLASTTVVVGAERESVVASIESDAVSIVVNDHWRRGNLSSLIAGVNGAPDAAAHVVAAGDLPSLSTASIDALVTCWNDVRPWAAVTSYADRIAHPFLLSPEAVEAAIELDGSKALWRLLVASSDDRVVLIDTTDTAPLDLNTPDDYRRATRNDPAS